MLQVKILVREDAGVLCGLILLSLKEGCSSGKNFLESGVAIYAATRPSQTK
jgi:hypothetical protein